MRIGGSLQEFFLVAARPAPTQVLLNIPASGYLRVGAEGTGGPVTRVGSGMSNEHRHNRMVTPTRWFGGARPGRARAGWLHGAIALVAFSLGIGGPALGALDPSSLAPAVTAMLVDAAPVVVDGVSIDTETLRFAYEARGGAPLWVARGSDGDQRVRATVDVLAAAADDGLDPRAYHVGAIQRRLGTTNPASLVELEVLLSDGVLRYAAHQTRGVNPPRDGNRELAFDRDPLDAQTTLLSIAEAPNPAEAFQALAPRHAGYVRLRETLRTYRDIEKDGGWPLVPDGPKLHVGTTSEAVPTLRRRLALTGEYESVASGSTTYDVELSEAVKRFQARHGLVADGVVGEPTRAALNVSVGRRIDQIVVNMERWRWLGPSLGDRHVKVNVPAFALELVDGNDVVLAMPVVVGKQNQRTPNFSSEIRQLVFNPPWYIPPSIARKEILPKARVDSSYLSRNGYVVRRAAASPAPVVADGMEGPPTPPPAPRILGLKQPPGPKNPLGRVKFDLPNEFGVYLHDTPSRASIQNGGRAASHGCIRLSNALGLAEALLVDSGGLSETRKKKLLSNWQTRTVALADPVPVHIVYETVWVDAAGGLHSRPDVYGRDDTLKKQLVQARSARPTVYARRQPDPEVDVEKTLATP